MKYCTSCGKKMDDDAKFCTGCGRKCDNTPAEAKALETAPKINVEPVKTPIPQKQPQAKQKKPASKGKVIFLSIVGALLCVAIIAGVLWLNWYNSTEQQVLRALESGDYEAAVVIMKEDEKAGESEALVNSLKGRISNLKTAFIDGTVEYATARMELDTIRKLRVDGINAELNETAGYIDALNQSRTDFATAESFYATGDYAEAIVNYRQVIEADANYSAAVAKLADAVNKYRDQMLSEAEEYARLQLYTEAVNLLNESLTIIANDTRITEQIRVYEKSFAEKLKRDALNAAAGYASGGDYLQAFQSLTNILKSQETDAELVSAYNKYCDQYAAQVIKEAEERMAKKDFAGAISDLSVGLRNLPGNSSLASKLEEAKAKQPVPVDSLVTVVSNDWGKWNDAEARDTFGNDHSTACNYVCISNPYYSMHGEQHYIEQRLYGKYTTLTGSIVPHKDSENEKVSYLQIFTDEKLVYTSADIDRKTDPIHFSVNVVGVDYVKVFVHTDRGAQAILYDVQLWP